MLRKFSLLKKRDHCERMVHKFKSKNMGLMTYEQYLCIAREIEKAKPCNLLVFGLGEDSFLWNELNEEGNTVFLEDNLEWIRKINQEEILNVFQVDYHTKVEEAFEYGYDVSSLRMDLPESVKSHDWDIILVDAPLGHQPPRSWSGPGRMSSIYEASVLIRPNGLVFVDDFARTIENAYANKFLGKDNLVKVTQNKLALFRARK